MQQSKNCCQDSHINFDLLNATNIIGQLYYLFESNIFFFSFENIL